MKLTRWISLLLCIALTFTLFSAVFAAENPFTDVKESDYFYDPVLWAVENQITNGISATAFGPNANCTRAQVVTFLWRAAGSPAPASSENPFTDVKESEYYYKAVLWAVENQITNGLSATSFGPNASCTRAQVVTFLWRADGATAPQGDGNPFKDIAFNDYFYNAVLWAVEKGITNGLSADKFGPNATCTRGQIVTFLYRYMMGQEDLLHILFQPEDYHMNSSMEDADFLIQVKGGTAPYTFNWVIAYDDVVVEAEPVTADSPIHVFSYTFSDYDFDEYDAIFVYCNVEDAAGAMVNSSQARVYPYFAIAEEPQDYQMASSMEDATFTVKVAGNSGPYSYQWVICYDNTETWLEPVESPLPSNTLKYSFSDYDFDDYRDIGVYCVITNAYGVDLRSETAEVLQYSSLRIVTQPQDYQMTSSQEDAEFTVEIAGGVGPYKYQWVVCYDNKETWLPIEDSNTTTSTLIYNFSDYDFDDYRDIGVYCIITDATGKEVKTELAEVLQHH